MEYFNLRSAVQQRVVGVAHVAAPAMIHCLEQLVAANRISPPLKIEVGAGKGNRNHVQFSVALIPLQHLLLGDDLDYSGGVFEPEPNRCAIDRELNLKNAVALSQSIF